MFRKTLTIFSLIGLLLSMGLWVASYWNVAVGIYRPSSVAMVFAFRGTVGTEFGRQTNRDPRVVWVVRGFNGLATPAIGQWFSHLHGFTAIQAPLYVPTLVFGAASAFLVLPWYRRRKRRKLGLCPDCGYDLRGSKDRCPECGSEFQAATVPSGNRRGSAVVVACTALVLTVGLGVVLLMPSDKFSSDEKVSDKFSSDEKVDDLQSAAANQKAEPFEGRTYRDREKHFEFKCPADWGLSTGETWVGTRHYVFLTVNSANKEDFWIDYGWGTPKHPGPLKTRISEQLPSGCVYLEIGVVYGPAMGRPFQLRDQKSHEDLEWSPRNWEHLLERGKDEILEDGELLSRGFGFAKWGTNWNIHVYFHEPVRARDRWLLDQLLQSFKFDAVPVGNERWAVIEAQKRLPPEAEPELYPYVGLAGYHSTRTEKIGDEVIVTFTKSDPNGKGRDRIWQFRVTATGEVLAIDQPR
ncbi:MAG: hypothetical protein O7D91_21635 [Planctomycetota bacterium]|nr:hypothetical protein [Planctomycetota bacterium]